MLIIKILLAAPAVPVAAQDGGQGSPAQPPDGASTIHVVQRGENLFRIAQQYGTTVEAISAANGLTDARFIEVGQRLIIPNVQKETLGVAATHVVQPGETLTTIAARYRTSAATLSRLNNILHRRTLYAGQAIQVNQGEDGRAPLDDAGLYRARPGDNLLRVAARSGVTYPHLLTLNEWPLTQPLYPGQAVILPDATSQRFLDLPTPLVDLQLGPLPVKQGGSLRLAFETDVPVTVDVEFMGRSVAAATLDGNQYGTFLGVHALAEPGVYALMLSLTNQDNGQTTSYTTYIEILDGGYGFESIDIPPDRQELLNSDLVRAELERVTAVMSQFTPELHFEGLFALPAPGAVTSNFGTRRSYNDSAVTTFHGGADFGGPPGTPIITPASGVVVLAESLQVRGNVVVIDHGWGVYTGYWHQRTVYVQEGEFVRKGQEIGSIGSTGLSTGAHLHWEMWVSGVQVNPLQWSQHNFAP